MKRRFVFLALTVTVCLLFAFTATILGCATPPPQLTGPAPSGPIPRVYFIRDITPETLMRAYKAVGVELYRNVAVKISTGEPDSYFLRPELIGDLVRFLDGTIVETNTALPPTRRFLTSDHMALIQNHGYNAISRGGAAVILDAPGREGVTATDTQSLSHLDIALPVRGGTLMTYNYVGARTFEFQDWLILSHFKGHRVSGFGGAVKNLAIGIASSYGKQIIHSGGAIPPRTLATGMMGTPVALFQDAMAEAAKSVVDAIKERGGRIVYINVLNNLSIECDCFPGPLPPPEIADIGILVSLCPVAIDQASVDLVHHSHNAGAPSGGWGTMPHPGGPGFPAAVVGTPIAAGNAPLLVARMESQLGQRALNHAVFIGLGRTDYELIILE